MCACVCVCPMQWSTGPVSTSLCTCVHPPPPPPSPVACSSQTEQQSTGALWLNRMGQGLCVHVLHFWYLYYATSCTIVLTLYSYMFLQTILVILLLWSCVYIIYICTILMCLNTIWAVAPRETCMRILIPLSSVITLPCMLMIICCFWDYIYIIIYNLYITYIYT